MSEIIFKKDNVPIKKKRVLSEKQLQNLALGREKRKQKLIDKINKQGQQENIKQNKENYNKMKNNKKDQEIIKDELCKRELLKKEEQEQAKHEYEEFKIKFILLKNTLLDKTDDPQKFKAIRSFFKRIKLNDYNNIGDVKHKLEQEINILK